MRIEFETQDIESIVEKIIDGLKPVLALKEKTDDMIFDVEGLAGYLKVSPNWIYGRTYMKNIPHIKVGKYLRFSKRDIDKWLDSYTIKSHLSSNKKYI
jgi:excisionase family DNA binding protein